MGKATKDHVGEDPDWDVYTITSVMGGWMKEVFATHLKLEDHYAKEIVLFALQAQQARTFRAKQNFPFEYEVTHSMVFAFHILSSCITVGVAILLDWQVLDTLLHLASVVELCLGKSSVAFEELTDCIKEAQALLFHDHSSGSLVQKKLSSGSFVDLVLHAAVSHSTRRFCCLDPN